MLNQLRWVAISYITRPLVLVLLGLAAAMWALDVASFDRPRSVRILYPLLPEPAFQVDSGATLAEARDGRQESVKSIDLRKLYLDTSARTVHDDPRLGRVTQLEPPSEDFFRIVDEFPNLESVRYANDWIDPPPKLDAVARLPNLKYLAIEGNEPKRLTELQSLAELRRIDFAQTPTPEAIRDLAALPKLDTLAFQSRARLDDAVLAEVARLPHLETLILDLRGVVSPNPPSHSSDAYSRARLTSAGVTVHTLERSEGAGWRAKWAWMAAVR